MLLDSSSTSAGQFPTSVSISLAFPSTSFGVCLLLFCKQHGGWGRKKPKQQKKAMKEPKKHPADPGSWGCREMGWGTLPLLDAHHFSSHSQTEWAMVGGNKTRWKVRFFFSFWKTEHLNITPGSNDHVLSAVKDDGCLWIGGRTDSSQTSWGWRFCGPGHCAGAGAGGRVPKPLTG